MSASEQRLRIQAAIVCDIIRQESSGKLILIGVYSGVIGVQTFPATLSLAFFLQIVPGVSGEVPFEFRLVGPHDAQLAQIEGSIEFLDPEIPGAMPLPNMRFQVQLPGEIALQFRSNPDDDWEPVTTVRVDRQELISARQEQLMTATTSH